MSKIAMDKGLVTDILAWIIAIAIPLTIIAVSYFVSDTDKPSNPAPTSNYRDSEYQDAMDSKYYDPNSEGGPICNSPICN
jgi:hypothetical protein